MSMLLATQTGFNKPLQDPIKINNLFIKTAIQLKIKN